MPPEPLLEPATQDPVHDVFFQDCLPQLFSDHESARSPSPQLCTLDTWVRANVDNQALPRSVWQDIAAIQDIPHVYACLLTTDLGGRSFTPAAYVPIWWKRFRMT